MPSSRSRSDAYAFLLALFVLTRLLGVWLATQPLNYGAANGDLGRYTSWSNALLKEDLSAYSEVEIEYPPAVLPFVALPDVLKLGGPDYGHRFIFVMLLLDVAGFIGLIRLGDRTGSRLGPWVWALGGLLLGPIIYLRLDLIPAVATIWTIERGAAGRWGSAGGWLAFGALAKVYPGFFIFSGFEVATHYRRFLAGFAIVAGVILLPVLVTGNGPALIHDVIAYHTQRGIQIESTWGSLLLIAHKFGYSVVRSFEFGSFDAVSAISPTLKAIGFIGSLVSLAIGWRVVARNVAHGDAIGLAIGIAGTLALLLFFGTVYSPQFTVWLLAICCAALCERLEPRLQIPLLAVLVVCLLTQVEFPYGNDEILSSLDQGGLSGAPWIAALFVRNLLVGGMGVLLLSRLVGRSDELPHAEDAQSAGDRDRGEEEGDGYQGVLSHETRIEP